MVLPDNLCSHFFCSCVCVFVSLSIISTSWGQCFVALEPHSVCVPLQMEMVGRVWGYYQAPGSKAAFIAFLWASRKWRERASYRSVSPQIIGMSRLIIDDIPLNCSWNLWIVLFNMVLEKSYHDPVNHQFETYYFSEQEICGLNYYTLRLLWVLWRGFLWGLLMTGDQKLIIKNGDFFSF